MEPLAIAVPDYTFSHMPEVVSTCALYLMYNCVLMHLRQGLRKYVGIAAGPRMRSGSNRSYLPTRYVLLLTALNLVCSTSLLCVFPLRPLFFPTKQTRKLRLLCIEPILSLVGRMSRSKERESQTEHGGPTARLGQSTPSQWISIRHT